MRYPDITVDLSGGDGNAYIILAKVRKALWRAGISNEIIAEFTKEATGGGYDNLLQVCMKWVNVN